MQIVVPMSGIGKRFRDAGYTTPKYLIEVEGKKIIEHIISLFPGEENFIFICNQEDVNKTSIKEILKLNAPKHQLKIIKSHKKGPVFAVKQIFDEINDEDEVIVNYCDFGTYWDYNDFLKHTRDRDADGAVVAYKGFHPHMIKSPNYAFIKDKNQWLLDIKEKEPFTDNKMNEYASNGTYYFKRGKDVKKYFDQLMDQDLNVNGEYYVSMVYKLMAEDARKVSVYKIQHMLQWGTPEDLEDYLKWSEIFADLNKTKHFNKIENCVKIIPAAGEGKRFYDENYDLPKPLIDVSGYPMVLQASKSLPECEENCLILRSEHIKDYELKEFYDFEIIKLDKLTEGQAITCSIGLEKYDSKKSCLIASCDNIILFDQSKLEFLLHEKNADCIVFTSKPNNKELYIPEMFGWVNSSDKGEIFEVKVKEELSSNHEKGLVILGIFYFKNIELYSKILQELIKNKIKVNNEYYIDSMALFLVNQNMNIYSLEINNHISLGTPDEYKTFTYWQSYFNKNTNHPYKFENDIFFNKKKKDEFLDREKSFKQDHIGVMD